MVKIEVQLSHPRGRFVKYAGNGKYENAQGFVFLSRKKNGRWPKDMSDMPEWKITIDENHASVKNLTDELEKDFSDQVNKEIDTGEKYVPIIWELEFAEDAGLLRNDLTGEVRDPNTRIFTKDNIKIKKLSKNNDREREREQNWGITEANCWIGVYN